MKPTPGNVRKVAAGTMDPGELARLKDHLAFYISGAKHAAEGLGRSVNAVAAVLDEARAVEEFIDGRIRILTSR